MKETYLSRDFRETAAKFAVSVSQLKKSRIVLKQSCFLVITEQNKIMQSESPYLNIDVGKFNGSRDVGCSRFSADGNNISRAKFRYFK
jgi:hypothetical protein